MEQSTAFAVYLILIGERCLKDTVCPATANKSLRAEEAATLAKMQKYGTFAVSDVRRCFARALYLR